MNTTPLTLATLGLALAFAPAAHSQQTTSQPSNTPITGQVPNRLNGNAGQQSSGGGTSVTPGAVPNTGVSPTTGLGQQQTNPMNPAQPTYNNGNPATPNTTNTNPALNGVPSSTTATPGATVPFGTGTNPTGNTGPVGGVNSTINPNGAGSPGGVSGAPSAVGGGTGIASPSNGRTGATTTAPGNSQQQNNLPLPQGMTEP